MIIKAIKAALDADTGLELATKKTYKKPTGNSQPENYIYFISWWKVRIKTGYRQRFSFYIKSDTMATLETLAANLETLLVWTGKNIDSKIWKVQQLSDIDFEDEMIKVIDFSFYYLF